MRSHCTAASFSLLAARQVQTYQTEPLLSGSSNYLRTSSSTQIARLLIIVDVFLKYVPVKLSSYILMTSNFGPQLRLTPSIVLSSQERTINVSSLLALISHSKLLAGKMLLECAHRLRFSQVPSHPLEKRNAESLI